LRRERSPTITSFALQAAGDGSPSAHQPPLTLVVTDGLVPDSNLIRWVGAPAEITR
jgi:hypothetical protein